MDNCFNRQLKKTFSDNNLKKLGVLTLHCNSVASPIQFRFYINSPIHIKAVGDGGFSLNDSTAERTTTSVDATALNIQNDLYLAQNKEFDIEIENRYALTDIQLLGDSHNTTIDINELDYNLDLTRVVSQGAADYKSTGSINSFANLLNLSTIELFNNSIEGSIESLGKLTVLNMLNLASTLVTGSINVLAEEMVLNGRTSGNLTILCNGIIMYNNEIIPNVGTKVVKFGSSMENPTAEETSQGWQVV